MSNRVAQDALSLYRRLSILSEKQVNEEVSKLIGRNSKGLERVCLDAGKLLALSGSWQKSLAVLRSVSPHSRIPIEEVKWKGVPDAAWKTFRETCTAEPSNPTTNEGTTAPSLFGLPTENIVALAFDFKRPSTEVTASQYVSLRLQQENILEELLNRNDITAVSLCATNWMNRGLLFNHTGVVGEPQPKESMELFDGIDFLRQRVFLSRLGPVAYLQMLENSPLLFARCARDERVIDVIRRDVEPDQLSFVCKQLLRELQKVPCQGSVGRGMGNTEVTIYWRALAPLLHHVKPTLQREKAVSRKEFLALFLDAVVHTVRFKWEEKDTKVRAALKRATESICSSLIHNEAMVRHVGSTYFATLSGTLRQMGVSLPNALVVCLTLCIAQPFPPSTTMATLGAETSSPLAQLLDSPPPDRWKAVLLLLQQSQSENAFRVTPLHLRAVLDGLEATPGHSAESALAAVSFFKKELKVDPDEKVVGHLLDYHRSIGWQKCLELAALSVKSASNLPKLLCAVAVSNGPESVKLNVLQNFVDTVIPSSSDWRTSLYCVYLCACVGNEDQLRATYTVFTANVNRSLANYVACVSLLDGERYREGKVFFQWLADRTGKHRFSVFSCLFTVHVLNGEMKEAVHCLNCFLEKEKSFSDQKDICRKLFDNCFVLFSLTGMGHLREPVKLIGHVMEDAGLDQCITTTHQEEERRMFVPFSHKASKSSQLAKQFGKLTATELSAATVRNEMVRSALGESTVTAGVGPEYFEAAFM